MKDNKDNLFPNLSGEFIGRLIEQTGIRIRNGECELSTEEMIALLRMILHEKWYLPRLQHEFNVSQRTLERWCNDGILPPLREDELHRKFLWHDEVELWRLTHKIDKK